MTADTGSATDAVALDHLAENVARLLLWVRWREEIWRLERESADEELFPYANGMTTAYYCVRRRLEQVANGEKPDA